MDDSKPLIINGAPDKLGAHWDGRGVNFTLFSANAKKVELCLFDEDGKETRINLPARTDDIWHGYVPGLKPGQLYGYRVHGPYDPQHGHRFNPNKLLLDPCPREISGEVTGGDIHCGHDPANPGQPDPRDSAPFMVKARVAAPLPPVMSRPGRSWQDTVIYEAHARGLTMEFPRLNAAVRGTFAGLANNRVVKYLKWLGVTAIELLPVHAFAHEKHLEKKGLGNYWGYNSLSFFTPAPRYGSRQEFRAMVDKLHAAGIEVILDVVYNHTAEGDATGPTLSFRGIDNASYYRLDPHDKSRYVDHTGCGNTLNVEHPQVRRMIIESLRYWVEEMGVDGFRFDLATVLGREGFGFSDKAAFFAEIRNDPVLSKVKLIAEPWDIGPGGYQVGNFPPGWREWNDKFRDDMRAFWRGDPGMIGRLADRLAGSRPEFGNKSDTPSVSTNFVTAHDGFTLQDLVSYNGKHNFANAENNADGNNNNVSWNHGAEGPTTDAAIIELRERQKRNLMASLILSQGTPMLLAGDEFGNSQAGNNNAYCQDNPVGWMNWLQIKKRDWDFMRFTRAALSLRREFPVLRHPGFLRGLDRDRHGVPDIQWFSPQGHEQSLQDWQNPHNRCLGMTLNGGAIKNSTDNRRLCLIFNASSNPVSFRLPDLNGGKGWTRILDTAEQRLRPGKDRNTYTTFSIKARSLAVFSQTPSP